MLQEELSANIRTVGGKGAARTLRRQGSTPAVLYGPKIEPVTLSLDTKSFVKTLFRIHEQNAVIKLRVDGDDAKSERHVMLREIQTDPVRDSLMHADFYEISLDDEITVPVPLHYVGKAKGVDLGGELHVTLDKVTLKGKPLDIPDFIEVDIADMDAGAKLRLADIAVPALAQLLHDEEEVCVSVTAAPIA